MDHEKELEIAEELLNGKFELICQRMQLQNCPDYDECWLEGTGVIRADERGRLSFRIVAPFGNTTAVQRRPIVPHGQFYGPRDHVRLLAVDDQGREWSSNWFVPSPNIAFFPVVNWTVHQPIRDLFHSKERTNTGESWGRFYVPDRKDLPFDGATQTVKSVNGETIHTQFSADHHTRNIAGAEVEFRSVDREWLVVEARQNAPVMPSWAGLVCQSLSFATARTVRPVVCVREFNKRYDIGLSSGPFLEFRSHLSPPILRPHNARKDFWDLVQRFIEWSGQNEDHAASVFEELEGIRSGATGSIETACLTLAVGIEALGAKLLADEAVNHKTEFDPKEVADLRQYVESWTGPEAVKNRAIQMLKPFDGKPTTGDRLFAFAHRSGLSPEIPKRWKTLRNKRAHGSTEKDGQNLSDLYYSTVEFLYRIICSTVGYTGTVTETFKAGWGMDQWGRAKN